MATNPYYQRQFNAQEGQFAQAGPVRNEYQLIQNAFDLIDSRLAGLFPSYMPAVLGQPLTILRVDATGTVLEFVAPGRIPQRTVSASRALAVNDQGYALLCSSASAMTITFPKNATVAIPIECAGVIMQSGAGKVTCAPEDGSVVLRGADTLVGTRVQFSQITWLKTGTNEWYIGGDRG